MVLSASMTVISIISGYLEPLKVEFRWLFSLYAGLFKNKVPQVKLDILKT
jgi:hypothetical protein